MNLFKTLNEKSEGENEKFVGFHVSDDVDSLLSLFAISEGVSKSSLLRFVVCGWLGTKDPVQVLAEQAQGMRTVKGRAWSKLSLKEFIVLLRMDLKSKGIPDSLINKVIKEFKAI